MNDLMLLLITAVPLVVGWVMAVLEVINRPDLTRRGRAGWLAALVFLNVFALVVYVVVRPSRRLAARSANTGEYDRAVALVEAAEAFQRGVIDGDEFERRTAGVVAPAR